MPRPPWRPVRRTPAIRPGSRGQRPDPSQLLDAATWPLDECLVCDDHGALTVVWIRRHPSEPRFTGAVIRADLDGGGIEVSGLVDVGRAARWTAIEEAGVDLRATRRDPALAVRLLDQLLARRAPTNPDWRWVSALVATERTASPWTRGPAEA